MVYCGSDLLQASYYVISAQHFSPSTEDTRDKGGYDQFCVDLIVESYLTLGIDILFITLQNPLRQPSFYFIFQPTDRVRA